MCERLVHFQEISVEQVLKGNIAEWNVSINTRKEKNKWVYDTQLEYLGNTPVNVTLTNNDNTKITYNGMGPHIPAPTTGSGDYKETVYSKNNSILEFELEWEAQGKKQYGRTVFEVKPK